MRKKTYARAAQKEVEALRSNLAAARLDLFRAEQERGRWEWVAREAVTMLKDDPTTVLAHLMARRQELERGDAR